MVWPAMIVDVDALWQTAWTAAVAGVAVCLVFSCVVLGATRSTDMRLQDRAGAAALYGLLALAGIAGTLALVIFGVILITTK